MTFIKMAIAASALAAGAAPPASKPSFDCSKAKRADERLVCADAHLGAMDRWVAAAFSAALSHGPKERAGQLRASQKEWLGARAECTAPGEAGEPSRDEAASCVRRQYARRLTVLTAWDGPLPAGVATRQIKWSDARGQVDAEIAYPALDAPAKGAKAFAAWAEGEARTFEARARALATDPSDREGSPAGAMPSTLEVWFQVPLATPRLLTVVLRGYEFPSGAAHGLPFQRSATFDLERGRPLGEADLFATGAKRRAVDLVVARLAQQGYGDEEEPLPDGVREVAGDLANWTFRADTVEVAFPVYSVSGYAEGTVTVWMNWDELRPFLRADAPLPPM